MDRTCASETPGRGRCRAARQHDSEYCFFHDPNTSQEAAEARKLGGRRRRREGTIAGAYDLLDVTTVEGLWRVLEIVVADTISLDNGIARSRTLISAVQAGRGLLETTDHERRLQALEVVLRPAPDRRQGPPAPKSLLDEETS